MGLLLGLLSGCTKTEPADDPLDAECLEEATRLMTDLGPRVSGTQGEEDARAAVEIAFSEAGLTDVRSEPFTWDVWQPGTATVQVGVQSWSAEPLSPSPTKQVTGPLVREGELADAVAVLSSDDGTRPEHFATALFNGAVALVRVTDDLDTDGSPLVEVGHTLEGSALLAVAVDHPTGEALRALEGQPATVSATTTVLQDHVSSNVLGEVPGTGTGVVYVVAHYDSWHPSESAFDNALGVGAMLALARAASASNPPTHRIVFLATTGEEQGLQGAIAWTAAHEEAASDAALVLNLDVLWAAEGDFIITSTEPDLRTLGLQAASEQGLDAIDGGEPDPSSDHVPFVTKGAPAFWSHRWRDRHYHTTEDLADNLDFDDAAKALAVQWVVLKEAAGIAE